MRHNSAHSVARQWRTAPAARRQAGGGVFAGWSVLVHVEDKRARKALQSVLRAAARGSALAAPRRTSSSEGAQPVAAALRPWRSLRSVVGDAILQFVDRVADTPGAAGRHGVGREVDVDYAIPVMLTKGPGLQPCLRARSVLKVRQDCAAGRLGPDEREPTSAAKTARPRFVSPWLRPGCAAAELLAPRPRAAARAGEAFSAIVADFIETRQAGARCRRRAPGRASRWPDARALLRGAQALRQAARRGPGGHRGVPVARALPATPCCATCGPAWCTVCRRRQTRHSSRTPARVRRGRGGARGDARAAAGADVLPAWPDGPGFRAWRALQPDAAEERSAPLLGWADVRQVIQSATAERSGDARRSLALRLLRHVTDVASAEPRILAALILRSGGGHGVVLQPSVVRRFTEELTVVLRGCLLPAASIAGLSAAADVCRLLAALFVAAGGRECEKATDQPDAQPSECQARSARRSARSRARRHRSAYGRHCARRRSSGSSSSSRCCGASASLAWLITVEAGPGHAQVAPPTRPQTP